MILPSQGLVHGVYAYKARQFYLAEHPFAIPGIVVRH